MTAREPADEIVLLKEKVIRQTEQCQQRGVSMTIVKDLYREQGFPTAASWAKLMEKLANLDTMKSLSLSILESKLREALQKSIWFDDKAVRLYRLDGVQRDEALDAFHAMSKQPENSTGKKFHHKDLEFCDTLETETLVIFRFQTIRTFFERLHINPTDFESEETRLRLGDFDEVIGIKKYTATCYDSVAFLKDQGYLIITIDLASRLRLDGIHLAAAKVLNTINALFSSLGIKLKLPDNGENIFNCIENLYNETDGGVTEIAFCTDDGITHHEKIGASGADIRENIFHKYGKQSAEIQGYKLGKRFNFGAKNESAELLLPGSYRALTNTYGPHLHDAIFKKSETDEAFRLLLNKIISHKGKRPRHGRPTS